MPLWITPKININKVGATTTNSTNDAPRCFSHMHELNDVLEEDDIENEEEKYFIIFIHLYTLYKYLYVCIQLNFDFLLGFLSVTPQVHALWNCTHRSWQDVL